MDYLYLIIMHYITGNSITKIDLKFLVNSGNFFRVSNNVLTIYFHNCKNIIY